MVSIRPKHLKRYQTVAWLLIKHGRSEMVSKSGLADVIEGFDGVIGRTDTARAEDLATDLETHGPTFIKLGQLLSTRVDLLPQEYINALTRLQDNVSSIDFLQMKEIIETSLGRPLNSLFQEFSEHPLATASLSQVHRAKLHDGSDVVVKVRRPGVDQTVIDDLDAFEDLAALLEDHVEVARHYGFRQIISTFRQSILEELNFRTEQDSLTRLGRHLEEFSLIEIPNVYKDFSTEKVLTMSFVKGGKIVEENLQTLNKDERRSLTRELFKCYIKQIFIDGFFHGDPHPGNLLITQNHQLAILDLGMAINLSPHKQENLIKLMLAIAEGHGELAADITVAMGIPSKNFLPEVYRSKVAQLIASATKSSFSNMQIGRLILDLNLIAGRSGFQLPSEVISLSKVLLNLEKSIVTLDPEFDVMASLKRESYDLLKRKLTPEASLASWYHTLSESKDFAEKLPYRLNRILGLLANNKLRVDVTTIDEKKFILGLQKIANRITVGILLGSLILGASVMMHVETGLTLFGYPAVALILFLIAALGAITLIANIVTRDR
ncbi:MAG: AarF/ABC1/UbiB kinase family protein [Pseudobacteriovorax sp.]|nr:AarF/ABC1/UbiB kinase family protein [Pseudobacteriovorax sp.]